MPELPEVETITRILRSGSDSQPAILGLEIREAELLWERTLAEPSPDQFRERIRGQSIVGVRRPSQVDGVIGAADFRLSPEEIAEIG